MTTAPLSPALSSQPNRPCQCPYRHRASPENDNRINSGNLRKVKNKLQLKNIALCRVGNSLIRSSLICSFSHLLICSFAHFAQINHFAQIK